MSESSRQIVDPDDDDELIGVPEASERGRASPELPPLRLRGSLAARIVALVLLVVVATGAAALIIRAQVRGMGASFDLLTGVYIPFQTKLLSAQSQSQRIGAFVASFGNPEAQLDRGEELNLEEALDRRATLATDVSTPLEQALLHSARLGGLAALDDVRELLVLVRQLQALIALDEGGEVTEVLGDAARQADISRRFGELVIRANEAVRSQRDTVAAARRTAEERALVITIAAAAFSLLATLGVIWTVRPLRRLADSVRRIGRGEWSERLPVGDRPDRDDEVVRLAREINLMAGALDERERRLLRGERLAAIGRLAAQITHEIRNPLSSVALNTELLGDEIESLGSAEAVDEARQLLTRISGEVDRLTQITEAYLGFARRPKPQMSKLDLGWELTDLLDFLGQEHSRDRIRVVRDLPQDAVWVEADPGQLRQAFINLLRNAQEAVLEVAGEVLEDFDPLEPGELDPTPVGTIRVGLTCKGGLARVVVEDSGPGITMSKAEIERIFEAFVTNKTHGTGLGLPMVQQIAVDHGGAVRLLTTSSAGTQFEFNLPACDPPAPSVSSQNSA